VFLDRDGVLNRALVRDGKPYPPRSAEEFEILPGVPEACRALKAAGWILVVATNQPDVGRGDLDRGVVERIHARLTRELPLDRIEVCYDAGGGNPPCADRKPRPGMLLRAARELGLDLRASFMVGDRWRDIECGRAAGCRTILIDYAYAEPLTSQPDYKVRNLAEAADFIIGQWPKTDVS
jgi:D-glycero-D-manno-heptose 1,7-bisphosphate phosphatase